ncbi:MAG: TolC family protein, partial [Novosphingobium sp.]|nr:TolC family protein [Novosphingobium sp.]
MPSSTLSYPLLAVSAAVALLATGCVPPPAKQVAARLVDPGLIASRQSLAATGQGEWPADEWWRAFGDPQLDALIREGLAHAPGIAAAAARLRKANALAEQAGAELLAQADASGTIFRDRRSLNNGFGEGIKQFLPRGWRTGGDVTASAGFDFDLWGRNRARLAAATSEARAAAIDVAAARLLLATTIADAYADLGQLFAQRDIRQAALDIRIATRQL